MAFKVAIASGKGGTGKTTVSVNLYNILQQIQEQEVTLVDCDVEEPNDALFFDDKKIIEQNTAYQLIPQIDTDKCTFCGRCAKYCEFNAIVIVPKQKFAEINESLCHSCGACLYACKDEAITEFERPIGEITHYETQNNSRLTEGRLKIGSSMQTMLIGKVKTATDNSEGIVIYDAPPGTGCSVVNTVADADYVILVTEPTPFGLNDLKLVVELLRDMKKEFGVIVNKAGLGTDDVYNYLKQEQIELIGKIPFNRKYAEKYADGAILNNISDEIEEIYTEIADNILDVQNEL